MTDLPSSEDIWAAIEAKEIRVWVTAIPGLWCPACLLPSGVEVVIKRDPNNPGGPRRRYCADNASHRIPWEDKA